LAPDALIELGHPSGVEKKRLHNEQSLRSRDMPSSVALALKASGA
jgi:hypothetical protein